MLKQFLFAALFLVFAFQSKSQPTPAEIPLAGIWEGRLVYRDYGTDEMSSVNMRLQIELIKSDSSQIQWSLALSYPREPEANSRESWNLNRLKLTINQYPITAFEQVPSGHWVLEWAESGTDGNQNRQAVMQMRVRVDAKELVFQKWVRYEGESIFFLRNEFFLKRNSL